MTIKLDDPTTWPEQGSEWRHKNGNIYQVHCFTNIETDRQDEYPTTIVYMNVVNWKMYSRRLIDWDRSMTYVGRVRNNAAKPGPGDD